MSYKHFSLEERYYIEIELRKGTSINCIAKALGRPQGSVSKEISRNRGKRGYRHKQAHRLAQQRHLAKVKPHKMTADVCAKIDTWIEEEQWSPEQISGRIKSNMVSLSIMRLSIAISMMIKQKVAHCIPI